MEQIKDLMKNIISCVSAQATHMDQADSKEMSEAMDMIKDLAMAEYYCAVTKAMENPENVYGEDWDENGPIKKGYMSIGYMPSATTSYGNRSNSRRGYDSYMMDEPIHRNMYYSDNGTMRSRYDSARRGYEEAKDISSLNRLFDVIEEDVKELKHSMTAQDKQTAHQRLTALASMINV